MNHRGTETQRSKDREVNKQREGPLNIQWPLPSFLSSLCLCASVVLFLFAKRRQPPGAGAVWGIAGVPGGRELDVPSKGERERRVPGAGGSRSGTPFGHRPPVVRPPWGKGRPPAAVTRPRLIAADASPLKHGRCQSAGRAAPPERNRRALQQLRARRFLMAR